MVSIIAAAGSWSTIPQPNNFYLELRHNRMTTKQKTATPPTPKPRAPSPAPSAPNARQAEDLRWQRTVRFNWDNGGKRGGSKDGRK